MLQKKNVLITGCSSGIGKDLVIKLLDAGYNVIASMRNLSKRKDLFSEEIKKYPNQLLLIELDVCSQSDRGEIARLIDEKFSSNLFALINNAGFGAFGALEDFSEEQIRKQLEVNFFGLLLLTKELLRSLRNSSGYIINISSVLGYSALPLSSMYCASKFALEGLSESLYHELKPFNIKVCLVEPGGHKTSFKDNLVLAENSRSQTSIYYRYTENYLKLLDKKIRRKGTPASNVSAKILTLLKTNNPLLHNPCGYDAIGVYYLKKLFPQRMYLFFSNFISRTLYYKP